MLIKQKNLSLPRNLALGTFGELLLLFSTKVNLLYLLYSMTQRWCLLRLITQNCLLKTFLRTLFLMAQVSFYLFSFTRTNLKQQNVSVTCKLIKKVITNLILVVVLMNCELIFHAYRLNFLILSVAKST